MNHNPRILTLVAIVATGLAAAACSSETASEPTVEPAPATVVPTREPPTEEPMVEASSGTTSPEGLMAIAVTGPAVQVLSGMTDEATFVVGVPAMVKFIAADSNGVGSIEITVDGESWKTWEADGQPVYQAELEWVPAVEGLHQVGVVAYDTTGVASQLAAYAVTILPEGNPTTVPPTIVSASPVPGATPPAEPVAADSIPPAVSISAEKADIEVGADFDIHTNAVDQGGVVKLELWVGGVLRDTWAFEGPPEEVSQSVFRTMIWRNPGPGEWEAYVKAWDSAGNVGESIRIDVTASVSATATPLALPTSP